MALPAGEFVREAVAEGGGQVDPVEEFGDPGLPGRPSATDEPTDLTVGFSRPCITTAHHGTLTVPADQAICIGPGGSQDGKVTVQTGGSLAVSDARITGAVTVDGALALAVCRSTPAATR
ncbi:hypothetical protein [Streptomyces diastatochromogenes]|uniref:hypothetical protein n=1 Tax=Streptomyces diastatochromogenes TaxID=42236 RepID=UPI0036CED8F7